MPTLFERVQRWRRSWQDVGDAFIADDPLLCDDVWCDCDLLISGTTERRAR